MKRPSLAAIVLVLSLAHPARTHYNMLLPDAASVKRGQEVVITYQWGHPFEHQLFDAPAPAEFSVFDPAGSQRNLSASLEKIAVTGEQKQVRAYRTRFTASDRGDYVFLLRTPPIWMEEEHEFLLDTVKVALHVQIQRGWDRPVGAALEMVPLTRPYGLEPGTAFQAQALAGGKALAGALVEVEHYHAAPPKDLPPDEQMTRTAKTDPNGVVTCTLGVPGWWAITVQTDGGKAKHDGAEFPVRRRSTLWVFVDDRTSSKSSP
jgi:cobalt/nickel transport protein